MARVQAQPGPDTTGIGSLCHRAFMGSEVLAKWCGQSAFTKFRVATCHCFAAIAVLLAIAVMIRSS